MAHYDRETLALLAMGEHGVTDDGNAHLTTCVECRREVDRLTAVAGTARRVSPHDRPQAPPHAVWQRVVAGIADPARVDASPAGDASPVDDGSAAPDARADASARARSRRRTAPARRWAGRRPLVLAAASALVGVVVGAGTTYGIVADRPQRVVVTARFVLEPLDAPAARGTAVLDRRSGGRRTLTVRVEGLPAVPTGYFEVWLMNAAPQRLLALGVLDAAHAGQFQIPPGLDLSRYPVVDISLQGFDAGPAHSGDSVVRGSIGA